MPSPVMAIRGGRVSMRGAYLACSFEESQHSAGANMSLPRNTLQRAQRAGTKQRPMRRAPFVLWTAAALGALTFVACKKPAPEPSPEAPLLSNAPAEVAKVEIAPRCTPASSDPPFVLGPANTGRPTAAADAGDLGEPVLPFAAEVGDGVAFAGGFAVGAIYEADHGQAMSVVTLGHDGHNAENRVARRRAWRRRAAAGRVARQEFGCRGARARAQR